MAKKLIFKAIEFAAKAHSQQFRKGTRLPYIIHPLEVGNILIEAGCSDEIIAAGILHDTLEDTAITYEDLVAQFGKEVADLVVGASEPDKADTWENRKLHTINYLKTAPLAVVLVTAADKWSNFRATYEELLEKGEKVWSKFNRGKEKQQWYMQSLAAFFLSRLDKKDNRTIIFKKVSEIVEKIFPANSKI